MIRIGSPHPFDPGGGSFIHSFDPGKPLHPLRSLVFGQPLVCDLAVTLPCLVKLWWFVIFVPPPCSPSANLTSPLCSLSILLTIFSVKLSFMGLNWIFIHRRAFCALFAARPRLSFWLSCAAALPQRRLSRALSALFAARSRRPSSPAILHGRVPAPRCVALPAGGVYATPPSLVHVESLPSLLPAGPLRPPFQRLVSCASHIESRVGATWEVWRSARAGALSVWQFAPAGPPAQRLVILYLFESRGKGAGGGGL